MRKVAEALLLALSISTPIGDDPTCGPVLANMLTVHDGDTMTVRAVTSACHSVEAAVRADAVGTPELRGKGETEGMRSRRP